MTVTEARAVGAGGSPGVRCGSPARIRARCGSPANVSVRGCIIAGCLSRLLLGQSSIRQGRLEDLQYDMLRVNRIQLPDLLLLDRRIRAKGVLPAHPPLRPNRVGR